MTAVAFVLAAGAGAAVRHGVNLLGWSWRGTLLVNAIGSALLGWIVASDPSPAVMTTVGVGFLGSLTTFSMFAIEMVESSRSERLVVATATVVVCLVGASVGHALG